MGNGGAVTDASDTDPSVGTAPGREEAAGRESAALPLADDPAGAPDTVPPPGAGGSGTDGDGGRRPRYEEGMNFGAVLRATEGHRDDLPPPPDFDRPAEGLSERCRRALYEVADPEFPISLVDLGLVYDVDADEEAGRVVVHLTFTATSCPCMDFIRWDVRERLLEESGVESVEIEEVWDPPWTTDRISDRGREILARAGVAV